MKDLKGKVTVIMPAYNEERHILHNIEETIRVFDQFTCNYEIIVVDDGSLDNTYKEAVKAQNGHANVIVKRNIINRGKGRAIKRGFRFAQGDYIVFLDADLDLHPEQIKGLFDIMKREDSDIVIGSKRHSASVLNYPKRRKIISYVYNLLVRILFASQIRDTQTGLKVFKRKVLDSLFHVILVKRFAFDVELLMVAHHIGYKISDAPIEINFGREQRIGRIRVIDILSTYWDTLAVFYRMYLRRYYIKRLSGKRKI
ncbi:glycosyltransferase family 2 protein [bacterium]|nr:glycosyltransferase family 2 protein [bacterium]